MVDEAEQAEKIFQMGAAYEIGKGVEINEMKAAELYKKAAEQGHTAAIGEYAFYCCGGKGGVQKNIRLALQLWQHASEAGDANSRCRLGRCYWDGDFLPRNEAKAIHLLTTAAESNYELAWMWMCICDPLRYPLHSMLEKYEEVKTARGMFRIGSMYQTGKGVEKDEKMAREWYERAAVLDNHSAIYSLHSLYREGKGVLQSNDKALELLQKTANAGNPNAQLRLAQDHYFGNMGLTVDKVVAFGWFEKAAMQGDPIALYGLGTMYYHGEGVPTNHSMAFDLFRRAASQVFI